MATLPSPSEKLNYDDQREIFEKCAQGDMDARERIILLYIPLVKKLCAQYADEYIPFDDLFQEGCYGLILALNKFDLSMNARFSAFAKPYILKYIRLAKITQSSHPIVYREDFYYELKKYLRILDQQTEELQRTPTDDEMAEALHVTKNRIKLLSQSLYFFFPYDDLYQSNVGISNRPDHAHPSAEEDAFKNMRIFDISNLRMSLTEREEEVIRRRCGFTKSGVPESAKDIAEDLGLHPETVRLAYNSGIEKFRKTIEKYRDVIDYII